MAIQVSEEFYRWCERFAERIEKAPENLNPAVVIQRARSMKLLRSCQQRIEILQEGIRKLDQQYPNWISASNEVAPALRDMADEAIQIAYDCSEEVTLDGLAFLITCYEVCQHPGYEPAMERVALCLLRDRQ